MQLEIEPNPNCRGKDVFIFDDLSPEKQVRWIKILRGGEEIRAEVTGVDSNGKFVEAFARKVSDSGAGFGYLIYGGSWGIRLRPERFRDQPWDLSSTHQWGEPYMLYAEEGDIEYEA